jgi:hypothetical protein
MGGGLKTVSRTLSTSVGPISSVREIVGFASGKYCVIGRNMVGRVKPFADAMPGSVIFDESNPIAKSYFTPELNAQRIEFDRIYGYPWPDQVAKSSLLYKANEKFIKDLKAQGYTFIDLGSGNATQKSVFYDLELDEIFN